MASEVMANEVMASEVMASEVMANEVMASEVMTNEVMASEVCKRGYGVPNLSLVIWHSKDTASRSDVHAALIGLPSMQILFPGLSHKKKNPDTSTETHQGTL